MCVCGGVGGVGGGGGGGGGYHADAEPHPLYPHTPKGKKTQREKCNLSEVKVCCLQVSESLPKYPKVTRAARITPDFGCACILLLSV